MAKSFGKQVWKATKKSAVKGFGEGVQERVSNAAAGSGNGKKLNWGAIIVIVILLYLAFGFFAKTQASGVSNLIFSPAQKITEPIKSFGNFLFKGVTNVKTFVDTGDTFFTFQSGGAEIKEKTGLSFRDMVTFGSFVGDDFGINGKLIVGRFDSEIPQLKNVKLSCESEGVKGKVEIRNQDYDGEAVFDIFNPGEDSGEVIEPVHCTFDANNEKIQLSFIKNVNTRKMNLELTYPFFVGTSLEVFTMPEEVYGDYRGREDEAFRKLNGGDYSNYNSRILSKMKFISDVETSLEFDKQPLGVNSNPNLRFAFRNTNPKNEVKIEKFEIILPKGMRFDVDQCGLLDINENVGTLKSLKFKEIERRLNHESRGESGSLSCKIFVDENALGGSSSELVPAGKIISEFEYKYTLKSEHSVVLKKETEIKKIA